MPPLENSGLLKQAGEVDAAQAVSGTAITVTVDTVAASRSVSSLSRSVNAANRSMTGAQANGVINYYELAVQKLDAGGDVTTAANNGGWTYKAAKSRRGGTLWELFGLNNFSSSTHEAEATQGRLQYYDSNDARKKYRFSNSASGYWEASPAYTAAISFATVSDSGARMATTASSSYGCAPAFCVK